MTPRRASPSEPAADLPAYAVERAAELTRVSPWTLRNWTVGHGGRGSLLRPASRRPLVLSFNNLIETFVLSSIRRLHGISMQRVRHAMRYVGQELGYERPLIHASFQTDGVNLFVQHADRVLVASAGGQGVLREALTASLQRIDWEHNFAARLYPWVRSEHALQPKTIVIDPRRGFGQPVIAGTGVEARIVAQRYRAGESVRDLARDYSVDAEQIEDAIRCETREAA